MRLISQSLARIQFVVILLILAFPLQLYSQDIWVSGYKVFTSVTDLGVHDVKRAIDDIESKYYTGVFLQPWRYLDPDYSCTYKSNKPFQNHYYRIFEFTNRTLLISRGIYQTDERGLQVWDSSIEAIKDSERVLGMIRERFGK